MRKNIVNIIRYFHNGLGPIDGFGSHIPQNPNDDWTCEKHA